MRFFLLALALVSAPAFSAPACSIPGLPNITGKSYHLARGMLIQAGFYPLPSEESRIPREDIGPGLDDAKRLGYFEAGTSSQGIAARSFSYSGFEVRTTGCEDLADKRFSCTVSRVNCVMQADRQKQ